MTEWLSQEALTADMMFQRERQRAPDLSMIESEGYREAQPLTQSPSGPCPQACNDRCLWVEPVTAVACAHGPVEVIIHNIRL